MKYSIIVPIYNVEEYIEKCLESIQKQTYQNYEVILVNDGSTDKSEKKLTPFIADKRFKKYNKKNGGLSDARNYGVKESTGDYLLFVDSDDYIDSRLIENINNVLESNKYDALKFNFFDVYNDKVEKRYEKLTGSKKVTVSDLINFEYFEPACGYCFNTEFYKKNKFMFEKGYYHEDYGLIPIILTYAKEIYYLDFYGYYYVKRDNSIINDNKKAVKKAEDTLYFSIKNIGIIEKNEKLSLNDKALLKNFYANGAIRKLAILDKKKDYKKKLKKAKIEKYLLDETLKQKIKKIICHISYNLFIKLF